MLQFAAGRLKLKPSKIEIERLDAPLILAFLEHLERQRGNSARTRNARLAAINSFFRYLEYRVPSCLDQSRRIHAIPMKKTDQALVGYLTRDELQALLDAPDASTVSGIRDRAMLHLAFAAGMCVSELVGLRLDQIDRQTMSSVHIMGKGRRERVLPLWKQAAAGVKAWLKVRPVADAPELFFNARSVGPMCADASTSSPRPARRRSPAKRSSASPDSMPSRAISVVAAPRKGARPDCREAGRSSMNSSPGCAPNSL